MTKAPNFKHFRASSEKASKALAKIKASNTQGERILRSALWRLGFRFRKNVKVLPGKPDIVFARERVAIFCDGDFWHGRNWAKDKRRLGEGPNSPYWLAKIKANMQRDKRYNKELTQMGWHVIRQWDSDIKYNSQQIASKIAAIITSKREKQ